MFDLGTVNNESQKIAQDVNQHYQLNVHAQYTKLCE